LVDIDIAAMTCSTAQASCLVHSDPVKKKSYFYSKILPQDDTHFAGFVFYSVDEFRGFAGSESSASL
jgi:hypothetical protein